MKFKVYITETVEYGFEIEADNSTEAEAVALEQLHNAKDFAGQVTSREVVSISNV